MGDSLICAGICGKRETRLRRALSGRPIRIMLYYSDKFSPVRKVNEVSSSHSTGILGTTITYRFMAHR
jgi:hypothetical protein